MPALDVDAARAVALRLWLGLCALFVIGAGVMIWYAPVSSKGSIAGVAIGTGDGDPYRRYVRVARRNLGCHSTGAYTETCRTTIDGRELRLEIDHDLPRDVPNQFQFARCTATYGDRSYPCRHANFTVSGGFAIHAVFHASDVGIAPDALAALRSQNLPVNQPGATLRDLVKVAVASLTVGFALVVLLSRELGDVWARFGTAIVGGFGVFTLTAMIAFWLLFGLAYID